MNLSYISLLMIATATVCACLSAYTWRRRGSEAAIRSLSLFLASAALWSFFYGMEFALSNTVLVRAVMIPEYVGIVLCPIHFLLFAARYSGRDSWFTRRHIPLLLIVPSLTVFMVATNGLHHLYYSSFEVAQMGGHSFVRLTPGPFWYVHVVYSYTLCFVALVLLAYMFFTVSDTNRTKVGHLLLAALLPVGIGVAYAFGFRPLGFLDLTPLGFAVAGAILTAGIFTMSLLDIKPVALDMLVRSIPDAVFVLNANHGILDTNLAAATLLRSRSFREQLTEGAPTSGNEMRDTLAARSLEREVSVEGRVYTRTDTMLYSGAGSRMGTLIVMRDITERKQAEEKLRQSRDQYQSLVNSIPGTTYQRSPDGRKVMRYVSTGIEELTGFAAGEFTGATPRTYESLIDPADIEYVNHSIETALERGASWQIEYRIIASNGDVHWVFDKGAATEDRTTGESILNGFLMDITQQKRDRAEADQSHRELRRLATHLQTVREEERATVAWELHDEIGQALAVVKMDIAACEAQVAGTPQEDVKTRLRRIVGILDDAIARLRRLYTGLRPGMLDDLGLSATIEWQTSEFAQESGVTCRVAKLDQVQPPDARTGLAIFRVFQDVLLTIVRDSGATHADVSVEHEDGAIVIRTTSNGRGILQDDMPQGFALRYAAMRDRLLECNGTLSIHSDEADDTITEIRVPLAGQ